MKIIKQVCVLTLLQCHALLFAQIDMAPDSIPAGQTFNWVEPRSVLIEDSLVIGSGATWNVSNAIIYFKYHSDPAKKARIIVKGNLNATNCIFTSFRDDSEGDINGDGMETIPKEGDWGCLYFEGTDAAYQNLENCVFRYGGGCRYARNYIDVGNATVYQHWRDGFLFASGLTITRSKGTGIVMDFAYLANSTITYCEDGIRCISDWVTLGDNLVLTGNRRFPVLFDNCFLWDVPLTQETVHGNRYNGIAVKGLVLGARSLFGNPLPITYACPLPLYIASSVELKNVRLTLVPGTRVRFLATSLLTDKASLVVGQHSVLEASATAQNRITFTSSNDTLNGNETLGHAYTADWGSISGSRMVFSHCDFRYGGLYYDALQGVVDKNRSAVLRLEENHDDTSYVAVTHCTFSSLYSNAVYSRLRAVNAAGMPHINASSFLLANSAFGILCADAAPGETLADGTYNWWNSKTGPYHAALNPQGNGCRVSDGVAFIPYSTASDDSVHIVTSALRGKISNEGGLPVSQAKILLTGKRTLEAYSDALGNYEITGIDPGFGYELAVFAQHYHPFDSTNLMIHADTVQIVNIVLRERVASFMIDTLNFNINPRVSRVGINGTASRFYKVVTRDTHRPVYGVKITVDHDTTLEFTTDEKGIARIRIPSSRVGGVGSRKTFRITQIGDDNPLTAEKQIPFTVEVETFSYLKSWSGEAYISRGIFSFQSEKRRGSALEMLFKTGADTIPDSLYIYRKSQNGVGFSQGESNALQMGDFYTGSEAEVGVNMFRIMEDAFKFDYAPAKDKLAMAQFIVLADGMLPYMDGPLMRMFVRCLEHGNDLIKRAALTSTIGCRVNAYGNITGGLALPSNPLDVDMQAYASVNGEANSTFLYSKYEQTDRTDFSLALSLEASTSRSFSADFGVLGMIKGLGSTENPNPVAASAGASVHGDMVIGTAKNIDAPFSWLSLGYGYEYDVSANFLDNSVQKKKNLENYYTFYFRDGSMNEILKNSSQISKTFLSPFTGKMDFSASTATIGNAFTSAFNSVAERQNHDPLYQIQLPYEKTAHEEFSRGGFDFKVSLGVSVISVSFGAGYSYTGLYKYPEEKGVFYDYTLYPLEQYSPLVNPDNVQAKAVVTGIITNGVGYVWNEIKDDLNPVKFFRRAAKRLWGWITKSDSTRIMEIGPPLKNSSLTLLGTSTVQSGKNEPDSLYAYYWDWYGIGDTVAGNKLKKANRDVLRIQNYVRARATSLHKLDYGIGGFYQFEPYNSVVTNEGALLKLAYLDEELTVMLNDSSEFVIPEAELRVYREDKVNNRWVYVGGRVNTDSNYVSVVVDTLGTFTLAPYAPGGTFALTSDPDTIRLETDNKADITSSIIYGDNGDPLADGEWFLVETNTGTTDSADAVPELPGTQVATQSGRIHFSYYAAPLSGIAAIKATSMKGNATGFVQVPVVDGVAPGQPVPDTAFVDGNSVVLGWKSPGDLDVAGYKVYYDTVPGGPYKGTASVAGTPSPVSVGNDTSTVLLGLKKGATYYFVVTAVDRCGNEGEPSDEFALKAAFNHAPELRSQLCEVAYDAPYGAIVDTVEASDADGDQVLTYFLAPGNTCEVFRIDPSTGILYVNKEDQLDALQADTLYEVQVGVSDNGEIPLTDDAVIYVVVDRPTRLPDPEGRSSRFELHPNPATSVVQVQFYGNGASGGSSVMILDPRGSTVLVKEYRNRLPERDALDVSALDPGVYMVVLQTSEGRTTRKLVIGH